MNELNGKPYGLEFPCCWRCWMFVNKYGMMACTKHTKEHVEPNYICNDFAVCEEDTKEFENNDNQ